MTDEEREALMIALLSDTSGSAKPEIALLYDTSGSVKPNYLPKLEHKTQVAIYGRVSTMDKQSRKPVTRTSESGQKRWVFKIMTSPHNRRYFTPLKIP